MLGGGSAGEKEGGGDTTFSATLSGGGEKKLFLFGERRARQGSPAADKGKKPTQNCY